MIAYQHVYCKGVGETAGALISNTYIKKGPMTELLDKFRLLVYDEQRPCERDAGIAQSVEQLIRNQQVSGCP